jgi:polyhydroxyalkanoate synthase subunit PhaC
MNSYNTDTNNNSNIKKNDNYKNHNNYHLTYPLNFVDAYIDVFASSIEFYSRLNSAFIDAVSVPFKDAREEIREIKKIAIKPQDFFNYNQQQQQELQRKIEKIIFSRIRKKFDANFREKTFVDSLSEFVESYSNLINITGIGFLYENMFNLNSFWNNVFIEPIRDTIGRTPSHKINLSDKYSLMHYAMNQQEKEEGEGREKSYSLESNNIKKQRSKTAEKIDEKRNEGEKKSVDASSITTPLLIIYAFINRHYILDLLPNSSIVQNFQRQGFNVFATDWGTPSGYDKELTIGHYVNNYLAKTVDYIIEHTGSDKVSLFGYCWGGNLALMLAALYPEKIKNVIAFATPGDFSIDNNLLSIWTRNINADSLVEAFGNVHGPFINSAFLLRSPIDFLHKYPHFFLEGELKDIESIIEFFATETWLFDSPPVIGQIYKQFVQDCYQKNLFIKNKIEINGGNNNNNNNNNNVIDLSKINHPFLNIVASRDDLVAPESSKALNDVIGSSDKSIIEFNSGHVGACISSRAHKELWPTVGDWLKKRS